MAIDEEKEDGDLVEGEAENTGSAHESEAKPKTESGAKDSGEPEAGAAAAAGSEEKKPLDLDEFEEYVTKQISSILFGVISPVMIKKMASAKIVTPELYDKEGYPVDGGLMDIRLGVIDPGLRCKTCGSKLKECVGHFGYISLARPVIHINFVTTILNVLRSTCRDCSRILIPADKLERHYEELRKLAEESPASAAARVKQIITSLKTAKSCPHCNGKQFKVTVEKPTTYLENEKRITPIEIRTRLEKVTDSDAALLGLNSLSVRPEWLVLTIMPIPPVTMRPSITLETGERSEDDLTHKLGDIVRINQRLFENINAGAPEIIVEDLWDLLQYHITTFFDNSVPQLPPARHRSGQPLKTLSERIKSKEGRIRHNLAGKRTNFSARTVISPDPRLELNEVGVPMQVAQKLTVPERLTEWNMEYLKKFVERGPTKYPGANYIVRPDGKKKKITEDTKEASLEELQPGYIVERHLMDGDVAIFNRQPSLHRMSMMCHRVRVLPGRTFRLNPSVNNPYNADFDGDEMNLHIPQTEAARAEAEVLMLVETQMISPSYGLSVIGCIQDAISGNYLLTKKGTEMPRNEAVDLLMSAGLSDFTDLSRKEIVTGKDIFSAVLPQDFNFTGKSRSSEEPEVIIRNGKLLNGVMDSSSLGEGSGLLLRNIHKRYGAEFSIRLLGRIFRLGAEYAAKRGFTTSLSDTDLSEETRERISELFDNAKRDVDELIQKFHSKQLESFPGKTIKETLELKILELLNKARNQAGNIVIKTADPKSHTIIMAASGARGSTLNLAQMAASVGQQALRGKRIDKGFHDRTLSCFKKNDLSPDAHGFVRNSFKAGLSPSEFFFQAMVGRDSLMDTALRTPKSGYLYRRLANAMQDLKVEYDSTVRDASKKIVQFKYGEDGIDISKSTGGKVDVKRIIEEVLG